MAHQVIQPILSQHLSQVTIGTKVLKDMEVWPQDENESVFFGDIVIMLNGMSARQTQQVGDSEVTCV